MQARKNIIGGDEMNYIQDCSGVSSIRSLYCSYFIQDINIFNPPVKGPIYSSLFNLILIYNERRFY